MSTESNKDLIRRYVEEVLNQKKLAVADELFAPSFVDHDSSMPEAKGPDGIKRVAAMVQASFPDLHFTIEDMIAEGNKVVYRYSFSATHQKDFMGFPATGNQVSFTGIHIYRVGDGKLQEKWKTGVLSR
jgi:steroid delta-isomerase-like uncharacterized protein